MLSQEYKKKNDMEGSGIPGVKIIRGTGTIEVVAVELLMEL